MTAPLMLAIAAGMKLSSPGPVLFRQHRYGLSGKVVEVWKLRTMSVLEDGDEIPQARRADPRVTRFGAFLRRTSLDELPQFFNVLRHTSLLPVPDVAAHRLDAVLRAPPAALPEILREKVLAEAREDAAAVR